MKNKPKNRLSKFLPMLLVASLIFMQLSGIGETKIVHASGYTYLSLSTTSGKSGDTVTVSVNAPSDYYYNFDYGYIYFDSNNDGNWDYGEPEVYVYGYYYNGLKGTLTIPSVSSGSYNIRYESSEYSSIEASSSFTVKPKASMSLSSSTGMVGNSITVSLSDLPSYDYGYIYFDKNNNGSMDSGEGQYVYSYYSGTASSTITIPDVSAGTYNIKYTSSYNTDVNATASYTVSNSPQLSLSSTSGKVGDNISVSVSSLPSYDYGYIYLDSNNNGSRDYGEQQTYVYTYSGSISSSLTVPSLTSGSYSIRYESSKYSSVEASSTIAIKSNPTITLSSSTGTVGSSITVSLSNLPSYDYGYIYFDKDDDGTMDSGEGQYVYAYSSGTASTTLTVPDVSAGTYDVKYVSSNNSDIIATASFTVKNSPQVTLSSTSVKVGSSVTVSVSNIPSDDYGYIYFDSNNNGSRDYSEPQTYVYSYYSASLSGTLTVPSVTSGSYNIKYQSSKYTSIKASSSITVKSNPTISLSSSTGTIGSSITVSLSNLPAYDYGYIYFDKDNDGIMDSGESQSVYAYSTGTASTTITVPDVSAGTYNVKYVSSYYSSITASTSFTVKDSSLMSLSSSSGKSGNYVTAYLSNLPSYDYGYIYFDSNKNGSRDYGEPQTYVSAYYSGSLSGGLTIPSVNAGSYNIKYESSKYSSIKASSSFTVKGSPSISLSSSTGTVGKSITVSLSNLPAYDFGYIYFDKNNNGTMDSGEGQYVYSYSSGTISSTITVPDVDEGTYTIGYESSYTADLSLTTSFTVQSIPVSSISLNKTALSLTAGGDTATLSATVSPSNASNTSVEWLSSDETVAMVDDKGVVTPLGEGTATITVSTLDGSKTASCTVTVKPKSIAVTQVSLDKSSLNMTVGGDSAALKATINPDNATDKNVSWSSSNTSVATVDSNGTVKPVAAGTATITVTTEDGNKTATCTVTVAAAVVDKTDYTLSELINDEDTFNNILAKFSLDKLKVKIPQNYIQKIKITQNDTLKLSSFQVTVDADTVDSVKIKANGKEYTMNYEGDGVYKTGVYNLPKGCEVIVNAYDGTKVIDSSVQRLRTLDYTTTTPDKTEYTLEELVDDLDVFNEILGSYTLDQIHVIAPTSYIKDVQIKYSTIATAITAIVKNGANKVEFETKINGQVKTFKTINKGDGRFEGSVAGLQPGAEIKIKVYKDDTLVDQIVKKVTK